MNSLLHAEMDTTTPAVILKLDRNVMHHGGLGAIRSLGRLGVPVYGVHEDPLAPAANSRYLSGRWIWRPFPDPPAGLPRQLVDKYTLHQLCRKLGVPCAAATLPGSVAEAEDFAAQVGFPLVAKLATPWLTSGSGLRSTSVVHTRDELVDAYRVCTDQLMLQEYIPRSHNQDCFFHGYADANARCRRAFVGRKVRSYPPHAGLTSLGHWVDNPELRGQATELLARLGFAGIVDLDYRWDPRDGQYKLLDSTAAGRAVPAVRGHRRRRRGGGGASGPDRP